MAKVRNNPAIRGISGGIGNMVFRQMPNGETWVSGKPNFSRRKFSPKQKQGQGRFKEAVAYAREASKTHPIYAQLAAGTVLSAYNVALSDWYNPPVIHSIERKDGRIRVQASDNVMVTKVVVTVADEDGNVVEKGEAMEAESDEWWEYEVSSSMYQVSGSEYRVIAEAWDLAGNVVRKEL